MRKTPITFREYSNYISQESRLPNGIAQQELELTMYVYVQDLSFLGQAIAVEEHEQWRIKLVKDEHLTARIRKVDNRRMVFTIKRYREERAGAIEIEQLITEDMWNGLLQAASDGYKKTRYSYPVPNTDLVWEVDVFFSKSGEPSHWVKVDLEVKQLDQEIPKLPFTPDQLIISNDPENTEAQIKQIDRLWDNEWQRLDPDIKHVVAIEE